jgi:hypothetical protein
MRKRIKWGIVGFFAPYIIVAVLWLLGVTPFVTEWPLSARGFFAFLMFTFGLMGATFPSDDDYYE